ncbi:MAG: hypothetical protein Q9157_007493 [Trypethelium eluteriae]
MSASPAGPPSGRTPNGGLPSVFVPKKRKNNPLVPTSRTGGRKPLPPPSRPIPKANGTSPLVSHGALRPTSQSRTATPQPALANEPTEKEEDLGPPDKEFPVVTTKRAFLNGIRHHAIRLQVRKDKDIDIYNETTFTRPIRLHRRNPRLQPGDANAQDGDAEDNDEDPERKLEEQRKAERQAIREANQAQIAPNTKANPKKREFNKKIEQVYRSHDNLEAKKRSQLRYEETMPWHLEDFDYKNCWVGSYEAPMSEAFVVFVPEEGRFRMVPIEKWYKFNQKAKHKVLSAEEAEARMAKGVSDPKFVREAKIRAKQEEQLRNSRPQRLLLRRGERGERPGRRGGGDEDEMGEMVADENDLDFDAKDEFQDDEENPLFDDEEIEKEAERRITREQKEANIFKDLKEEKDFDAEDAKAKLDKEERRKLEKATRKALRKAEHTSNLYGSDDSDKNPYSDTSESSDSETERQRLEEEAKQKEKESTDKARLEESSKHDGKPSSSKPASGRGSGTNTPKGSNTPSGRPSKHPTAPERLPSSSSLKRPGSPNLSETDGNESSRKKPKKKHDKLAVTNMPTTAPNSRPMSPRPMSPEVAGGTDNEGKKRKGRPAGSGSDTETDGQRKKKLKLKLGGRSPDASRAGSPAAPVSAGGAVAAPASAGGSRAGSPAMTPARPLPTGEEIKAAISPAGTSMKEVINMFRSSMAQDKAAFISLIRQNVRMQKTPDGQTILFPRGA